MALALRAGCAVADTELVQFHPTGMLIGEGEQFARPLQRAVRDTMWQHAGVVRDAQGLEAGFERLAEIRGAAQSLDVRPTSEGWSDLAHALDLHAALLTAQATLRCALARRETRGAHIRSDHTELDGDLRVSFVARLGTDADLAVSRRAVTPVPEELRRWVDGAGELDQSVRLLE